MLAKQETIKTSVQVDFDGVLTVTPSWFDECLTQLADYISGQVELLPTDNASIWVIRPVLSAIGENRVADVLQRAMKQWSNERSESY